MDQSLVATTSLGFRYRNGTRALDDVTLHIASGVTGVIGLNGAGKSTLFNVLAGITRPTSGTVSWFGSPRLSREMRARTALMSQSFVPPPGFRVREYLEYVAWLRDVPRTEIRVAVARVADQVGLTDRLQAPLRELSGGMLRRVLMAQALVAAPRLLLLDEPTTGLDPQQRVRVRDLIVSLDPRIAVVVSSHIVEDVFSLADHLVVLHEGRVLVQGERREVFERLGVDSAQALETSFVRMVEQPGTGHL